METDEIQWTLCHQLPDRLRLRHPVVRNSPLLSRLLEDHLNRLKGVRKALVRPSSGSVILFYDPEIIPARRLIDTLSLNLSRVLKKFETDADKDNALGLWIQRERRPVTSLNYHVINVVGLSAFMAYVLVRRLVFRSPIPQRPFSMTGIVATVGAVPLFRRAWTDFRQGKQMGLFPFLGAACGLAIATGEALTGLEIIWVLGIGMLLETYVTDRARRAIREILQVTPEKALVLGAGAEKEVPSEEVRAGDTVVLRAGRKIPIDGTVLEGEALVDEAHISGRSQPEVRTSKDRVYAGTFVRQGMIHVRAEKVGEETYLCRIIELVEDSLATRTEAEKKADNLAARLTRIGVASTAGTFIVTGSVARAFSVMLVMACPCATVLAASTAVSAAIANAAAKRIFIKGGLYLERVADIDTVCFDKTGTVTTGAPAVTGIFPLTRRQNPLKILAAAAGAEAGSEHPVAKALVEDAAIRGIAPQKTKDFSETIGQGVEARSGSRNILVGNRSLMDSRGVKVDRLQERAVKCAETGQTVIYVAIDGRPQGIIALSNTARQGVETVLKGLRHQGIRHLSLISGDTKTVVRAISESVGFDDYEASMLPEEKAHYIERLAADGRKVLMVGDGVNDALALSKAAVGVAMGAGGSEVAVETADIALAGDELEGLVIVRLLSQQTLRVIEQNFWIANATNFAGILLGATGWLPPVAAGFLHIVHTLGIMLNSGRLMRWEPQEMRD